MTDFRSLFVMLNWEQLFKSMGFSESAAKVYMSALELGPSPVQNIARKIGLSRMTCYTVIETLIKEGLMSTMKRGKKTLYTAESPERLHSFMQSRVKLMEGTLKELEHEINTLKLLQRGEKPVVKMFEGIEGIRAIADDILQTNPEIINEFGNLDAVHKIYTAEELLPLREALDAKKIIAHSILGMEEVAFKKRGSSKVKILKGKEGTSFSGDISVYENKIALMALRGKLIGVLIESEEIANTMRALFKLAWENEKLE